MLKLIFLSRGCISSLFSCLSRCCASVQCTALSQPCRLPPVGSWLIPGSGALCAPGNAHTQFGAPLSLSPAHSCERYSSLRSHRPAPYASPYAHRNNSPSKSELAEVGTELSTCSHCLCNWGFDCVRLLPVPVVNVSLWRCHHWIDINNKELSKCRSFKKGVLRSSQMS